MSGAANHGNGLAPSPLLPPPEAGTGVGALGHYRLLRRIGEGGMSVVFLAYDLRRGRHVAVKVLGAELSRDPDAVVRFHREGWLSRSMRHPNIVRGIDSGQDRATGRHYLSFEYVDGPSVQQLLDGGRLPIDVAVRIALDVAAALEYLHAAGYVHRDIKPGNILLDPEGRARLADLGLARRLDESPLSPAAPEPFGTPYYMPHEQTSHAPVTDGRGDLFALGATLYHMVAGEVPFLGSDPQEIARRKARGLFVPAGVHNPEVPVALDRILARALEREPGQRYPSAAELIADLQALEVAAPPTRVAACARPAPVTPVSPDPMASTQPELLAEGSATPSGVAEDTLWQYCYRSPGGNWCYGEATTRELKEWSGRGGPQDADLLVCRDADERYRPLDSYREFRCAAGRVNDVPAGGPAGYPPDRPRRCGRAAVLFAFLFGALIGAGVVGLTWLGTAEPGPYRPAQVPPSCSGEPEAGPVKLRPAEALEGGGAGRIVSCIPWPIEFDPEANPRQAAVR